MARYDKKVIQSYINGDDIEDYDIEQLENDFEFMVSVIQYTKDKNMYQLCSNHLKNNYDFVKYIIDTFKEDIHFVCKVADSYLENNDEIFNTMELVLIMMEITKNKNEDDYNKDYMKYSITAISIYHMMMAKVEIIKKKNDPEFSDEFGMGFWFIIDAYNGNDKILNYFAERFIEEIMYRGENLNFEKMLHQKFDRFEDIERIGLNNFILNFLYSYDNCLSSYVSIHLNIVNFLKEKLNRIRVNWKNFNNLNEKKKYEMINEFVYKYIIENDAQMFYCKTESEDKYFFSPTEVLYYIACELKITDLLEKYDEDIKDDLEYFLIDKNNFDPKSRKDYLNIKKIIIFILNQKVVSDIDYDQAIEEIKKKELKKRKINSKIKK